MIKLNSDALKRSGLSSEKMVSIATIIHHASDSPTSTERQRMAFYFLTSLQGVSTICLGELLNHFDADDIANCISVQKGGILMSDFWMFTKN